VLVDGVVDVVHAFRVFVGESSGLLDRLGGLTSLTIVPMLFTPRRYIDYSSIDSIYAVIKGLGKANGLGVVLNSLGGDADEAYLLGRYLQGIAGSKLVTFVPRFAKSAAMMIACASDEIVMTPIAELGPIDPVLREPKTGRYIPLQSILELLTMLSNKELPKNLVAEILNRLPIIELGDFKRAVEHNVELCAKLLRNRMFKSEPERAERVARALVGFKQHSAAITLGDAEEIGLVVSEARGELSDVLWSLYNTFMGNVVEVEELTPDPENVEFSSVREWS
jgi:Periplasmic serine proteases (ClpP class)